MRPAATLSLYAGALALVFVAAVGVGNAVGPVGAGGSDSPSPSTSGATDDPHGEQHSAPAATASWNGSPLRLPSGPAAGRA